MATSRPGQSEGMFPYGRLGCILLGVICIPLMLVSTDLAKEIFLAGLMILSLYAVLWFITFVLLALIRAFGARGNAQ